MYTVTVKPMRSLINTLTDLIRYLVCSCPISSCLSEKTTEAKYKTFVGQMSFICMRMKKKIISRSMASHLATL